MFPFGHLLKYNSIKEIDNLFALHPNPKESDFTLDVSAFPKSSALPDLSIAFSSVPKYAKDDL